MTILIVRHGETDGNALRILQRADVPLNERGQQQAAQLARRLCADGFVHILCSDFERARDDGGPDRRRLRHRDRGKPAVAGATTSAALRSLPIRRR